MPFQRKNDWEYAWAKAADAGQEFIASISAREARERWTFVLSKVQDSGVLVVRLQGKPVGIIGSPLILLDILRQRRAGKSGEWHRDIEIGLEKTIRFAELQDKPKRAEMPIALSTLTINISSNPKSVAALLRQFDAVAVTYRHHRMRAFLVSLPVLASAWTDAAWTDRLLEWMRVSIRATDEPLLAW